MESVLKVQINLHFHFDDFFLAGRGFNAHQYFVINMVTSCYFSLFRCRNILDFPHFGLIRKKLYRKYWMERTVWWLWPLGVANHCGTLQSSLFFFFFFQVIIFSNFYISFGQLIFISLNVSFPVTFLFEFCYKAINCLL